MKIEIVLKILFYFFSVLVFSADLDSEKFGNCLFSILFKKKKSKARSCLPILEVIFLSF